MTESNQFEKIKNMLKDPDSDNRRWAVYSLEGFEPKDSIDFLIEAIQDNNRAVRMAASEVIEGISPADCVTKLVPLLGSEKIEVRNIVAANLVAFGENAVDDLLPSFTYDNEDVRKFSADILGLAGSDKAVEVLCKSAIEDEVENVVVTCIEALGKIASPKALPTLYRIVEEIPTLRNEAIEAIGLIGESESVEFLLNSLDISDPILSFAIIDSLGNIGDQGAIKSLKEILPSSLDILKSQIYLSILKIGRHSNINVFTGESEGFISSVISCLDEGGSSMADLLSYQLSLDVTDSMLLDFFKQKEKLPSSLLVGLINSAGIKDNMTSEIVDLVNHPDDWVAYTALECLSNLNVPETKTAIISVLKTGKGLPIMAAIKACMDLELIDAIGPLKDLMTSEEEEIKHEAIEAVHYLESISEKAD